MGQGARIGHKEITTAREECVRAGGVRPDREDCRRSGGEQPAREIAAVRRNERSARKDAGRVGGYGPSRMSTSQHEEYGRRERSTV